MPRIDIDAELFEYLRVQGHIGDTFSDVIRDLIGLPRLAKGESTPPHTPPPRWPDSREGALIPLLSAGLLDEGQEITWDRPGLRVTYTAAVDDLGRILFNGQYFKTPNLAAIHISGYPSKGWTVWRTADGRSLADLRALLEELLATRADGVGRPAETP